MNEPTTGAPSALPHDAIDVLETLYAHEPSLTDEELNRMEQQSRASTAQRVALGRIAAVDAILGIFDNKSSGGAA